MLGGCALLALIAILAAVKQRPGIAAFAGGLLALGLVLPAGALLSYVSLRSDAISATTHSNAMATHAGRTGRIWTAPIVLARVWPRIGILLIIGVAIAVFAGLSRRSTTSGERARSPQLVAGVARARAVRVCGAAVFHELCPRIER